MSNLFRHFDWIHLFLVLVLFAGFPSELSATPSDNVKKILIGGVHLVPLATKCSGM